MKEFEKWWQNYYYKNNFDKIPVLDAQVNLNNFKSGWEAALEWVLSRVEHTNSEDTLVAHSIIILNIEEELKNE